MVMTTLSALELDKIKDLYYVQKKHMADIARQYNVSLDSAVSFMRRHKLKRRSPWESNRINFERKLPTFTYNLPKNDYDKFLEIAGIMLYWAEGYKNGSWIDTCPLLR
jgi:hypothetical protein